MRTTGIPYDLAKEVLEVLELCSSSAHALTCATRRRPPGACTCHVEKARTLRPKFRHAAKLIPWRADQLRPGQWLYIEHEQVSACVVSLSNLPLSRVLVRVTIADQREELTFDNDAQVTILDETL